MRRKIRAARSVAFAATVGIATLSGFAASAASVPVANPSFESPIVPAGGSSTVITGWTNGSPGGGVFGPNPANFIAPNGNQVAFTGPGNGAIIYQDTGVSVTPGDSYTLSVMVGQLSQLTGNLPLYDYRLMIGYGGHDLATTTIFTPSSYTTNNGFAGVIGPKSFLAVSNSGTAPGSASGHLLIFLDGGNANSFGVSGQALWDSVALTNNTAVPLPAAAWLLLSGLGGLGIFARRKRPS